MIVREYRCTSCGHRFERFHMERSEPTPECPLCSDIPVLAPSVAAFRTNKGRAMDITQKIAEEDFGLTDMKDRVYEGEIAAKMPIVTPEQKAAADKVFKPQTPGMLMQIAKVGAQRAKAEGRDPLKLLHNALHDGKPV